VTEYRIDDLARAAGTTVRSVRVLHDRRLLPPPRLRGRTGWYGDDHVARVRLVLDLQERGHTLAAIRELLSAWEDGRDLADVLGIPSQRWAAELAALGLPPDVVADLAEPLRRELRAAAGRMTRAVADAAGEGAAARDAVARLGDPARAAVGEWFALAMAEAAAERLGRRPGESVTQ
jgi:DNA-binding transcriptional MerR regulator